MVGERFYIKAKFSMATIPKGEKFAILGDQSWVVFATTYLNDFVRLKTCNLRDQP